MKCLQVKFFKDPSIDEMERKANIFLLTIPSHEVVHTALRDGLFLIAYREVGAREQQNQMPYERNPRHE